MKIAILTFHRAYNCGAMLQAWALQTTLRQMGHSVEFPKCNYVGSFRPFHFSRHLSLSGKSFCRCLISIFGRLYLDIRAILGFLPPKNQYDKLRRRIFKERNCRPENFQWLYDCVIIGSDQVWNPDITEEFESLYTGEDIPDSLPIVAYSASCGDYPLNEDFLKKLGIVLRKYKGVSVREPYSKEQIAFHYNGKIDIVADPTLLLRKEDYAIIQAPVVHNRPYIYVYALWASDFIVKTADEIARRKGLDLIITPVYSHINDGTSPHFRMNVTPDKMVGYIAGAEYVIASSFHGTALSILHGKKFLSLREALDEHESRPAALLNRLGLMSRLVTPDVSIDEMMIRIDEDYPSDAMQKLELFRNESLDWLRNTLSSIEGGAK